MNRETVFIGFGSNMGDRREFCDRAMTLLSLLPWSELTHVSSLYETEPVFDGAEPGPAWFLNGAVRLDTQLSPQRLLETCREVERALGRDDEFRAGPRTLDLDLLFYGAHIINQDGLVVPHPRLHYRRFVLVPLAELDPHWEHPVLKRTNAQLLDQLHDPAHVRRLETPVHSRYGSRPTCHTYPSEA